MHNFDDRPISINDCRISTFHKTINLDFPRSPSCLVCVFFSHDRQPPVVLREWCEFTFIVTAWLTNLQKSCRRRPLKRALAICVTFAKLAYGTGSVLCPMMWRKVVGSFRRKMENVHMVHDVGIISSMVIAGDYEQRSLCWNGEVFQFFLWCIF